MFSTIYIEEEVLESERVKNLLGRFAQVPQVICDRYGEVFNRKSQNFRLQKTAPALILAKKYGRKVLTAPSGYGYNDSKSYYFSHMLNCVYDCRYCFLQGMYSSANYVLFINFEDFEEAIEEKIEENNGGGVYYSGYDCDSLALEPVSNFCSHFLPVFRRYPDAELEIRTKSTQVRCLLDTEVVSNCVIAMSFTTNEAAVQWEHKVPSIEKRLEALHKLQLAGWNVAIRFEPLILGAEGLAPYETLFSKIFSKLDVQRLHSVSSGLFRMPVDFHKRIVKLYPDEELYARPTETENGMIGLKTAKESSQLLAIEKLLLKHISAEQYYRCA
ncbi:MAG: DNA photolyase [SAR86 cluster bacterium]|uniref:DNA photolyase n=1 Tax=SAR86 cluster bacterium TaxID=2030880 RepID=A0A2A4X5E1_9GAMM|nr:MAG: DNA photolyase [SAR86 cluster bacterium]